MRIVTYVLAYREIIYTGTGEPSDYHYTTITQDSCRQCCVNIAWQENLKLCNPWEFKSGYVIEERIVEINGKD